MRRIAAALILLASGLALGAELPGATVELTLDGSIPTGVRPGATGGGGLALSISGHGFVCAQATRVTVGLAVDDAKAAEGVVVTTDNATVLTIPQGAYTEAQPYAAKAAPNATLLVARYAAPGSTSVFTVRAAVESVAPATGCTLDRLGTLAAETTLTTKLAEVPPGDPAFHPDHEAHEGVAFDKVLKAGDTFEWTPAEPGRYPYHDHFAPEKKALVHVLRNSGETSALVRITKDGFLPSETTLKLGGTVRWVNEDSVAHTVSADEQHNAERVVEREPDPAVNSTDPGRSTPGAAVLAVVLALGVVAARARR